MKRNKKNNGKVHFQERGLSVSINVSGEIVVKHLASGVKMHIVSCDCGLRFTTGTGDHVRLILHPNIKPLAWHVTPH
ncbi:MAG: hypothetical protein COT39_00350 [Parcubacteria group bacterium CG08_land_8_20_14_0_20_48_21]|nr:MAG: hypothetical protein AUK21_00080 [Parcubacteria group bacterium CG2_30_48_51]PIS33200.1 MAG: hypothetical protein COT39_00350 [Parcubacteria group bacterium CG08_land_8_20_14_0_20_48_21]PIW79453.1 MAG: hypothetical protein COZ99_00865 [Parcubacteria group bacterium CG_4_8_14_3_um_filter_48_16]PIY77904.1 MAG: hypothetical protein COY83_02845 [Parcubacteria group bacterium CG_4_10_14_0_8_um_filter_48_154]PIZ76938.1 MAG: hypothetical protein COY03_04225 [bacterium CG_4_10_14_0_2_um_filter_